MGSNFSARVHLQILWRVFHSSEVSREAVSHVLERYVQLITRNGVTQGIFLEGGLSRDGKLGKSQNRVARLRLGVARDPALRDRLYIVPVAINYESSAGRRSLLRSSIRGKGARGRPALRTARRSSPLRMVESGATPRASGKRYGRAAS